MTELFMACLGAGIIGLVVWLTWEIFIEQKEQ